MAVITGEQTRQRRSRLAILSNINLAALLLLTVCEFVIAERTWFTTLLTYMPQQPFIVPAAVLLLLSLFKRQWRLALVNGLAALICLFTLLGFNIPKPATYARGYPVRVMTLNLHHLSAGTDAAMALIEREKPDILCLQEVNRSHTDPVERVARRLPGWYVARTHEVAVLSRYPIRERRVHRVPNTERAMLEAVCEIEGKRFAVLNIHMSTASEARSLRDPDGSRRAYLRLSAAIRAQQVRQMLEIAEQSPYPRLVAGDFNTPPRGILYRRLCGSFTDTFARAGWGTGYTFSARLPVMRIDYVFADKGFAVMECRRSSLKASDHYSVVADVMLLD
ncbi:MAG: endonuclease/exonuclease/phosphatase family protein [Armatimonadota bacterium]